MVKLQQIKRKKYGSVVSFVNLPLEMIEELGWKKGDDLEISAVKENDSNKKFIVISKEGVN